MDTISSQCQAIMFIKQLCHCFKPIIKQKGSFTKILMDISVRYLHNDTIKPNENCGLDIVVDSMTHKVLISDTKLVSFIPSQLRKRTPKLLHICRCELCIITKDMQIDLNISRTINVTNLQQKYIWRHTCNSLFSTKSAVHDKDRLFPDGE